MACALLHYQTVFSPPSAAASRKLGGKSQPFSIGTCVAANTANQKVLFSSLSSRKLAPDLSPFLEKWQLNAQRLRSKRSSKLFRNSIIASAQAVTEAEEEADLTSKELDVSRDAALTALTETTEQQIDTEGVPRKKKPRGLNHIMQILKSDAVQTLSQGKDIPDIRTGDIVQLRLEVPQNKKRLSLYRGIVIAKHNAGLNTTFTIRRVIAGVGVEMVFPLYSPNIKEIKVVSSRKVRRAKLYYLRHKLARLSSV